MRYYGSVALLALSLMAGSGLVMAEGPTSEVTGKVMAVFYEPVKVNTQWLDKVQVTIAPCNTQNQLATYWYTPGSLSDDNALGFLFRDLAHSARAAVMKTQYMTMVSGHVGLVVDAQNHVSKTTFWGYNWECGRNISAASPAPATAGGYSAPATTGTATMPAQQPATNNTGAAAGAVLRNLGRFGF